MTARLSALAFIVLTCGVSPAAEKVDEVLKSCEERIEDGAVKVRMEAIETLKKIKEKALDDRDAKAALSADEAIRNVSRQIQASKEKKLVGFWRRDFDGAVFWFSGKGYGTVEFRKDAPGKFKFGVSYDPKLEQFTITAPKSPIDIIRFFGTDDRLKGEIRLGRSYWLTRMK